MNDSLLEKQVLSCALSDPRKLAELIEVADSDCFTQYSSLFKFLAGYYQKYKTVPQKEAIRIYSEEKDILLFDVYQEIRQQAPSSDFAFLLEKLKRKGLRRSLLSTVDKTLEVIEGQGSFEALQFLENKIMAYKRKDSKDTQLVDAQDVAIIKERYGEYLRRKKEGAQIGVFCGLKVIDEAFSGFQKGEYIMVLGAPEVGKSILLLNWAYSAWLNQNKNIFYASLEMPRSQVLRRLDSRAADIPYTPLKQGKLNVDEQRRYLQMLKDMSKRKNHFVVADLPRSCSSLYLESQLSRYDFKFDLIIIDHQGLMVPRARQKQSQDWNDQMDIAREIKELARAYDAPVISIFQIRRPQVEKNGKKRKMSLSDIARGYYITYHADFIFGLDRLSNNELLIESTKTRDGPPLRLSAYIDYSKMFVANISDSPVPVSKYDWSGIE